MNNFIIIWFMSLSFLFSEVYNGNVLFTPYSSDIQEYTTYYMNSNNDVLHTWVHDYMPASMPYLLPDSSIVYPYKVSNPTMVAGGVGGGINKYSWNGNLLWNYVFSDSIYQHHHDIEPLPNGNILIIVWENKSEEEAYAFGRETIGNTIGQMWSTAILELNPNSGQIVWEWHLWDHLIQDINEDLPNYGIISEHPELFDINCGDVGLNAGGPQQENADWMHINSVHFNENLDQIILSSRTQNEIYIIDHSTTTEEAASHTGGISGKGGDFLYRWGNPQNYGRGIDSDYILSRQHSVNWIPNGYPGEGNIILFNNFHTSNNSAVLELVPPLNDQGNYIIDAVNPYGPETPEWIYLCNEIVPMQGGAFRLPNGNTIITKTISGTIFEINQNGDILWEYNHLGNYWVARAQKYSLEYLENSLFGDINNDGIINVLDIVNLVNIVLFSEEYNAQADVNFDNEVNILDIVLMVTVILNGLP